jgi:hypothetical protein
MRTGSSRVAHGRWLIENVDASDHPIDSVRRDSNEVVKRLLGEGVAYDAVSVGSYAHRYRRYWQNLIPGPLLHEMVEKRFMMRSVDQQVQGCVGAWTLCADLPAQQVPWTARREHSGQASQGICHVCHRC